MSTVLPLLSAAAPAELATDHPDGSAQELVASQKLDEQTFALLKDLQLQGASGLALELISPQLDGISDPNARLKFASILFDMMHVRGRYADAAELIRQELAMYPPNAEVHSPLLLPLKIRFIHHQMFYRPVTELWPQMDDLLNCCDRTQDPESYGDILFMLGGNLGTLRGNYQEARQFLVRAIAHAKQRKRSLHSRPVSAEIWRLSPLSRSSAILQKRAPGSVEIIRPRPRNSPANLHSRLPWRSGATKEKLCCCIRAL